MTAAIRSTQSSTDSTHAMTLRLPSVAGSGRSGMLRSLACMALLAMGGIQVANAQLQVEISGAGANQYPIAVADFADSDAQRGRQLAAVVRADLVRSGLFRTVDASGSALNVDSVVDHA